MTDTPPNPMPAKIIYALLALGLVFPVLPPLAGVIYAYVARGESEVLDSHLTFQIRTFWIALVLTVLCVLASATVIGLLLAVVCAIFAVVWALARLISGVALALKEQPIRSVAAMGFLAR